MLGRILKLLTLSNCSAVLPPIWLELDLADCQGITALF